MDNHLIYLGLGSNINPAMNIVKAIYLLRQFVEIESISSAWETIAVGSPGPNFINIAVRVRSSLSADKLKNEVIRTIESKLGRVRTKDKNAPRTIDIDILIVDDQITDDQIWSSAHVAVPLSELKPNLTHPRTEQELIIVANQLSLEARIKPCQEITQIVSIVSH